jgi:4-carboxymuconolactone decarboxylase
MTDDAPLLVAVSAALAAGDRGSFMSGLRRAAAAADPLAVEETLLQSYLFLGYPAALRGLAAWRQVSGRPAAPTVAEDPVSWAARGAETCQRVYGGQYPRLRSNIAGLHGDMERWMVAEGYGKVLSRPGLDLATRELCIIALLAPQDAAPQLYSHLRGALNAGASEQDVEQAMALIVPLLDIGRARQLREQWDAVRARRMNGAPGD